MTQDRSAAGAREPVWTEDRLKNPHAAADKQRRVRDMFAAIAPRYDLNNRLHSLGIDQRWRRKAVKLSRLDGHEVVVDVACGTGDLTLAYAKALRKAASQSDLYLHLLEITDPDRRRHVYGDSLDYSKGLRPAQVLGIDFTFEMLPRARRKAEDEPAVSPVPRAPSGKCVYPAPLLMLVPFVQGDAQNLPLPDACCDVVSIAFGIRNVADPMRALREFRRILRPGGRLVVLEFSRPTNPLIRRLYDFYCNQIMSRTAAWIAGDRTGAYRYLSASVETFKTREEMKADIESAGFRDVEVHPLTFGVAVVYVGFVP